MYDIEVSDGHALYTVSYTPEEDGGQIERIELTVGSFSAPVHINQLPEELAVLIQARCDEEAAELQEQGEDT